MRRTRHKLEPQCVHKEALDGQGKTVTTEKRHYKQTKGAHEYSVHVLVSVHMLQVCGHINNVVVLVALRIRVITSLVVNVPTYSLFTCM